MTKKELIVKAAVEIFAEKGFKGTTTAEIKSRAGVAQGTLFYHFKNKEGILVHIFHDTLSLFIESMASIPEKDLSGLEAIEAFLIMEEKFLRDHCLKVQLLMREMSTEFFREAGLCGSERKMPFLTDKLDTLRRFLKKGVADGSIRKLDVEKAAHLLVAIGFGVTRHMILYVPESPNIFPLRNDMVLDWLRRGSPAPGV